MQTTIQKGKKQPKRPNQREQGSISRYPVEPALISRWNVSSLFVIPKGDFRQNAVAYALIVRPKRQEVQKTNNLCSPPSQSN